MADAVPILTGLSEMYPNLEFIQSLYQTMAEFPDARWTDALSRGQMASKAWLMDELYDVLKARELPGPSMLQNSQGVYEINPINHNRIYICASWYGILGEMLLQHMPEYIDQIRGIDIDGEAVLIANRLLKHRGDNWKFKSTQMDIHDLNFLEDELTFYRHSGEMVIRYDNPDIIINTSCEHILHFLGWYRNIPLGKFVVMQSNDFFEHEEHVNCVNSLEEFADDTPMQVELFSGELELEKYTRFMRIGLR